MTSRQAALLCGTLFATLLISPAVTAQEPNRFRGMDLNHDGVITRDEWRGNDQSFREHDRNGDGVVSPDEMRQVAGTSGRTTAVPGFTFLDYDGNGEVTAQEWMRAFNGLDTDGNGMLSRDELTAGVAGRTQTQQTETAAFRAGRERGLTDGRQAGREDRARGTWDLDGQRELEGADAGYRPELGPLNQYQAGYREGFRQGYGQGYGPRR